MKHFFLLFISGVFFFTPDLFAHHSKDYIQLNSANILDEKHFQFSLGSEYRKSSEKTFLFEPALGYGILPFLAVEFHLHLEDAESESLDLKGTALEFQSAFKKRWLGLKWSTLLELARVKKYELNGNANAGSLSGSGASPKSRFHAAHSTVSTAASGQQIEVERNEVNFMLITARRYKSSEISLQASTEIRDGQHLERYGLGYKYGCGCSWGFSLEALGPFGDSHGHEAWVALQRSFSGNPFQIGYGHGLGSQADLRAIGMLFGFLF